MGAVKKGKAVFPAPAGVILIACFLLFTVKSFPRTCGGDPSKIVSPPTVMRFSPHLRG